MAQYIDIKTNEKVKIINEIGNFFELNNGTRVDKSIFLNKYKLLQEGVINPNDFLNQKTNIKVETKKQHETKKEDKVTVINSDDSVIDPSDFLKSSVPIEGVEDLLNVDTSKIVDNPQGTKIVNHETESPAIPDIPKAVTESKAVSVDNETLEEKKKRLIEEHNEKNPTDAIPTVDKKNKLNENGLTEYQERLRQDEIMLSGKDPYAAKIAKYKAEQAKLKSKQTTTTTKQKTETDVTIESETNTDPSYEFFKRFKRNYEISISFNMEDKISKPDFIKVMADGLEGDIIQYYTDEMFNNFIVDTEVIKSKIYEQIYFEVYGESSGKEMVVLIPGKDTSSGKKRFKYVNNKGKVVDMLPETAEKNGYKPATKKDLR